jgi:hypothetical protein
VWIFLNRECHVLGTIPIILHVNGRNYENVGKKDIPQASHNNILNLDSLYALVHIVVLSHLEFKIVLMVITVFEISGGLMAGGQLNFCPASGNFQTASLTGLWNI